MDKIGLKTPQEVDIMAEGGQKLSLVLADILPKIKPSLNTLRLDSLIEKEIVRAGGLPSFKMVKGYHHASCIGLNNEVVHSIPVSDKFIKKGDLVKVDLGMFYKGFHTDLSWTVEVETNKYRGFLNAGKRALCEAVGVAKAGNRVGHISQQIQTVIEGAGFKPVKVLTGHGVGKRLHEDPLIPGYLKGSLENTVQLECGMTLAIEIIYTQGSSEVVLGADGWTISTKDGRMAGLFEKTIAINKSEPLVLTPTSFKGFGGD